MSGISSPISNQSKFTLDALSKMANEVGDGDKIRGRLESSKVFGKKDTVTLYSSNKSEGKVKTGSREKKQMRAHELIGKCFENTIDSFPLDQQRGLRIALGNIKERYMPQQGQDLTGSQLKQLVLESNQEINTRLQNLGGNLNKTTTYDDVGCRLPKGQRSDTKFVSGLPLREVPISEISKSIWRNKGAMNLSITAANGQQTILTQLGQDQRSQQQYTQDLFRSVNTALGRPNFDIGQRLTAFDQLTKTTNEHLNPFDGQNRTDNRGQQNIGDNQDVFVLKYASKEFALFCTGPLVKAFSGIENGKFQTGMRDKFDTCNITLQPNGHLSVEGGLTLPIRKDGSEVATVRITMTAQVNSDTGNATIGLNVSNLTFNHLANANDRSLLYEALSKELPGGI